MDEIELTDAEVARVDAAADAASSAEIARILAERDLGAHAHLVAHTPDAIDEDDEGIPTGTRNALTACPDCTRGIQAHRTAPVLICSRLEGVTLPDELLAKATESDLIACGLGRDGIPLEG